MKDELAAAIHAYLYSITLELSNNFKIHDKIKDEKAYYHDLSVEIGWGTFYLNALWLLYNFDNKNVLFWQIEMTLRLLYETVADTSYCLTKSDLNHLRKFFAYLDKDFSSKDAISQYKKAMEDAKFHRGENIGSGTMSRINEYFEVSGIVNYNILSQFEHLNVAGFCSAIIENKKPTSYRKATPITVYYLAKEIKDVISKISSLDILSTQILNLEKTLDALVQKYEEEINE